jgi:hypothetical protein
MPSTFIDETVVVTEWKLRMEHEEELKRVMEQTGTSFRKFNGKTFWELAKECGHTSLDFNLCACKRSSGKLQIDN